MIFNSSSIQFWDAFRLRNSLFPFLLGLPPVVHCCHSAPKLTVQLKLKKPRMGVRKIKKGDLTRGRTFKRFFRSSWKMILQIRQQDEHWRTQKIPIASFFISLAAWSAQKLRLSDSKIVFLSFLFNFRIQTNFKFPIYGIWGTRVVLGPNLSSLWQEYLGNLFKVYKL